METVVNSNWVKSLRVARLSRKGSTKIFHRWFPSPAPIRKLEDLQVTKPALGQGSWSHNWPCQRKPSFASGTDGEVIHLNQFTPNDASEKIVVLQNENKRLRRLVLEREVDFLRATFVARMVEYKSIQEKVSIMETKLQNKDELMDIFAPSTHFSRAEIEMKLTALEKKNSALKDQIIHAYKECDKYKNEANTLRLLIKFKRSEQARLDGENQGLRPGDTDSKQRKRWFDIRNPGKRGNRSQTDLPQVPQEVIVRRKVPQEVIIGRKVLRAVRRSMEGNQK